MLEKITYMDRLWLADKSDFDWIFSGGKLTKLHVTRPKE
jgi:hypothetical protein